MEVKVRANGSRSAAIVSKCPCVQQQYTSLECPVISAFQGQASFHPSLSAHLVQLVSVLLMVNPEHVMSDESLCVFVVAFLFYFIFVRFSEKSLIHGLVA